MKASAFEAVIKSQKPREVPDNVGRAMAVRFSMAYELATIGENLLTEAMDMASEYGHYRHGFKHAHGEYTKAFDRLNSEFRNILNCGDNKEKISFLFSDIEKLEPAIRSFMSGEEDSKWDYKLRFHSIDAVRKNLETENAMLKRQIEELEKASTK